VEFAVVGGHAVLCYSPLVRPDGTLRTIGDLDILVSAAPENLRKISAALATKNIIFTGAQLQSAFSHGQVPNLCGGYGAQLFPRILGVETHVVLRSVSMADSAAGHVPVISKPLLLKSKRACGRPKDLQDVSSLEAESGNESA
jgi:hypothetical protein